jgi:hypothetical protein
MPDYNQIDWIAAINGQTPEQYMAAQASYGQPTPFQTWSAQQDSGAGVNQSIWDAQQSEAAYQQQLADRMAGYNQGLGTLWDQQGRIEGDQYARANMIAQQNAALNQRNWGAIDSAISGNNAAVGDYGNAVGAAGAWDMANFSNLQRAANAPMQMTASPYVGDAQSNAADVARQAQVFGQLQGAANGSLDQKSRAAQAYANAGDIRNQEMAARTLQDAGEGRLNVDLNLIPELEKMRTPDSIGGMTELLDAARGSKDVHVGQEDPAAYAAMVAARDKLWGLTDPTVTAQERLMFEIARQQQEGDEGAARAAAETAARRRGSFGAGTEIARGALGAQQTSRNRMLQDMAALAQAQQRSMEALNNHGNLSANMSAQANQIALQNASNQLGALQGYTGIHAQMANTLGQIGAANASANANRQLQAQSLAYQAYAELRAQGFSEEYARGQAADVMATANADRRLGAMNSSAALSTDMRNASDAMSRFNQGQRQQQSQFSDSFAANRQDAAYGRQVDVWNAGNTTGRNFMTDQGNLMNARVGNNNNNVALTQTGIGTQTGLNAQWLGQANHADATALGGIQTRAGILAQQQQNLGQVQAQPVLNNRQKVQDSIVLANRGQQQQALNNWTAEAYPRFGSTGGGGQSGPIIAQQPNYGTPYGAYGGSASYPFYGTPI